MKKILLLIAMAITSNAIAQQHVMTYYDYHKKFKHEDYLLDNHGQKNGKYASYYSDGTIEEISSYIHGEQNGKKTYYYREYDTYCLASVTNYKNGLLDGLQQKYFNQDEMKYTKFVSTEELYKKNNLIWRKVYDQTDKGKMYLKKEEEFNTADKPYLAKGYLENGHQCYQIADNGRNFQDGNGLENRLEFMVKDGKKNGLYREWWSNGQLGDSSYYKNDSLDGEEIQYDVNGKITSNKLYIEGYAFSPVDSSKTTIDSSGHFKMYNASGKLFIEGTKLNGKLNGEYKMYFSNDSVFKDCFYKEGELDGVYKTFVLIKVPNTEDKRITEDRAFLESEINYKNGKLNGTSKRWIRKYIEQAGYQNLSNNEYNYLDGIPNGECIDYDVTDNVDNYLDVKTLYENGKVTKRWRRNGSRGADRQPENDEHNPWADLGIYSEKYQFHQ